MFSNPLYSRPASEVLRTIASGTSGTSAIDSEVFLALATLRLRMSWVSLGDAVGDMLRANRSYAILGSSAPLGSGGDVARANTLVALSCQH